MTVTSAIALYFIVWWLTLFAVLPLWVRGQHEGGDVVAGTEPGAPVSPLMLRKLALTTVLAAPAAAAIWALISWIE
jgi:hypothetical protein